MTSSVGADSVAASARGASSESAQLVSPSVGLWESLSFGLVHWLLSRLLAVVGFGGIYRLGRLFGSLEWLINYKRRRRFAAALQRVLGHKPSASLRRAETRAFFIRTRCDKLFYLLIDRVSVDQVDSVFTIENRALLDDMVTRGSGVYMAMSHHGPQLVAGLLLSLCGYPIVAIRDGREGGLKRFVHDRFDRLSQAVRPMRILFSDAFPREIYRCLKDGFILGSAMDVSRLRHPNQKTEKVTLFGEERQFVSGPLRVAIRCGAPVLQAFVVPDGRGGYRLEIVGVLLDPREERDEDEAVRGAMRTYAAQVEKKLRESPYLLSRI